MRCSSEGARGRKWVAVLALAVWYGWVRWTGIVCPFWQVLGIPCAGCGMTRAWKAVLCGNWSAAWVYHPLWWLPVGAVVWALCRKRVASRVWVGGWIAIAVLALGVYVLRLLGHDPLFAVPPPDSVRALLHRA